VYAAGGRGGGSPAHAVAATVFTGGATDICGVGSTAAQEPELHHAQCGVFSLLGSRGSPSLPSHCTPADVQTGIEPSLTDEAFATDIISTCDSSAAMASEWMNVLMVRGNLMALCYVC
jgi:hypothetical protein